jgi:thioredoxin-related protein
MLKKSLLTIGASTLVALVLFLSYGIVEKLAVKKMVVAKIQTLPAARLFTLDSVVFQFSLHSSIVLIHFNTSCEHCQYELREIKKNISSFPKGQVVLMSSENISDIRMASEKHGLAGLPNIHFTKINADDVFDAFGSVSVPHIFIYGKDHKLIKEFTGETKVKAILQYLK